MKKPSRVKLALGRAGKIAVAAAVSALAITSCASGGDAGVTSDSGAAQVTQNGVIGNQGDPGDPVKGGTLTYASYSFISSFDPAKNQSAGAQGGSEMAAIYDVLVRYDDADQQYVPQLAESLEPSDDDQKWTLKLRDGVKFNDGSTLDSAAVASSIQRYNANRGLNSQIWTTTVAATETPDPATVVFSLSNPWNEFPAMLAGGHGMIVAPSAIEGDTVNPVGAGPFAVERFAPNELLLLKSRADYWGGAPNLDKLRFVPIPDDNGKADSLRSGEVQVIYLRSPEIITRLRATDIAGYLDTASLGGIIQINGRPGLPGEDVRVRQAIAYATDVDLFDERANNGQGMPGAEIFQPWSRWHTDVAPLSYDPEKATALLAEAKADGYDGNISLTTTSSPAARSQALALQSMLQAVGFTVEIDYQASSGDVSKKVRVQQDYELAFSGLSLAEVSPFTRLYSGLQSESTNNVFGYQNPEMDAALLKVQTATSDEQKLAALGEVQEIVNQTSPFVALSALTTLVAWSDNVHGIQPTLDGILLFENAWVGA